MWHVTHDMWHMICNTQLVVKIVSKCQIPSSNGLGVMFFFEDVEEKNELLTELMNELMTKVFIEQARLHRVC